MRRHRSRAATGAAALAVAAVAVSACASSSEPEPTAAVSELELAATPTPARPAPTATTTPEPDPAESGPTDPTPDAEETGTSDEPAPPPSGDHPPGDEAALAAFIDPLVADLGLRFTYGSLIDRSANGTLDPSPTGDHLAVYVEPTGEYSDTEYIENAWTLALLTPYIFDRFPGLESWDICQEPRPSEDDAPVPPPVTQLDIFRGPAAEFDWENGSLGALVAAARDEPTTTLLIEESLQQLPAYVDALRTAG